MSSAFHPQGMNSWNNRLPQGGYVTWKGTGLNSNPVGTTAGTLRQWTNKDYANHNNAQQILHDNRTNKKTFGIARPIKHFRKGRSLGNQAFYNQKVMSSTGGTLVSQMLWLPGAYSLTQNPKNEVDNIIQQTVDCSNCYGIAVVADLYPNKNYLTNNPEPFTETQKFCCNEERKARRRVLPASTIVKKNYYQDLQSYRQSRCQTYDQRIFNFENPTNNQSNNSSTNPNAKPGGPLAAQNAYFANCQPDLQVYPPDYSPFQPLDPENPSPINLTNIVRTGCKLVYYKPNNYQYAKQGAVSSSARLLKLNVDTINTNLTSFNMKNFGRNLSIKDVKNNGNNNIPIVLKNKFPPCRQGRYHIYSRGEPKTCFNLSNDTNKIPSKSDYPSDPSIPAGNGTLTGFN
jgi:hypothetical protein